MRKIFNTLFRVDSRALGIYRILLGWLCLWDILRRWDYIDVFYSSEGIRTQFAKTSSFTIFNYIGNDSSTVHLVFIIGIIFSILLMIGYKSKLSHFITAIIIISIHVFVTRVGNSGDMFLNCMLIWTFFLPLGKSLSIDSLFKSLSKFQENSIEDLNNRTKGFILPKQIYSIAYFAMLFQISAIYFFTALDKYGYDWTRGKAFFKMHQLDGFITPIGYFARDYITYPISKLFTIATLYLEYSVPLLLFIPFYKHIFRLIAIIVLTIFHIIIRASINVGLFSQVMITSFPLLLDRKIIDLIKSKLLNRYKEKTFTLFYDSDCGFCHYTVRIIKRLDVFNRITFADANTDIDKPSNLNELSDKTAVLYNNITNQSWIRHQAFGKILLLLPFGFIVSWLFFIPFISEIFGLIYDKIAANRTKISTTLGLAACNIPISERNDIQKKETKTSIIDSIKKNMISIGHIISPIMVSIMLVAALFSALIENPGVQSFLKRNNIIEHNSKQKIGTKNILNKEKYFTWSNKRVLYKITSFPRMKQMWKMFSPNVLSKDNIIIVEAFLNNGDIINPFTGKEPVLDNTDYSILMTNKSQLWRKYFENFKRHDGTSRDKRSFTRWLMHPKNDYFKETLNGQKIDSIKIWKVSERSPNMSIDKNGILKEIKYFTAKKECLSIKKNNIKKNIKKNDEGDNHEVSPTLKDYFKKIKK